MNTKKNRTDNRSDARAASDADVQKRQQDPDQELREFAEESDSLWRIIISPVIWVFHFLACYIATAIICAQASTDDPIMTLRGFIAIVSVVSLAGILYIGWRSWKQWGFYDDGVKVQNLPTPEHRHEFLAHASFLLSIVSFIGVCYVAIPAIFLDSCL